MLRSTVSIRFDVRVLTGNSGIPHLQSHVDGLTRPLSAFFLVSLAVLWGLECCSNPFGRSYTTLLGSFSSFLGHDGSDGECVCMGRGKVRSELGSYPELLNT